MCKVLLSLPLRSRSGHVQKDALVVADSVGVAAFVILSVFANSMLKEASAGEERSSPGRSKLAVVSQSYGVQVIDDRICGCCPSILRSVVARESVGDAASASKRSLSSLNRTVSADALAKARVSDG